MLNMQIKIKIKHLHMFTNIFIILKIKSHTRRFSRSREARASSSFNILKKVYSVPPPVLLNFKLQYSGASLFYFDRYLKHFHGLK